MTLLVVSEDLQSVVLKAGRSIAGIVPNAAVEEMAVDSVTLTDHPVEAGAPISDHAYVNQAQLSLRWAWADGVQAADGSTQSSAQLYETLLQALNARQPIEVITGRRAYANMVILSLAAPGNRETENAFFAQITLREVFIVSTSATTLKPETQANPSQTAAPQNVGTVQPIPQSDQDIATKLKSLPIDFGTGGSF
jgi:hypothetical protein